MYITLQQHRHHFNLFHTSSKVPIT
uniref:Uncharacterized protein n=1 Tax=Anguilla anguilla TaxID=7936 RepID=A0A0E9TDK7_ANGAN